ncbi:MAG TPA: non-canonical purine NTP pyrophosphatase [Patescibacteria group bacterium]|nr:non-canonical purine NTP pyrophosphatase [Patescibacteria group bacterium]
MSKLKLSDLVVVTSSPDKLAEINEILGTNHKVSKLDIPEIQSLDLEEVITHKAREAYKKIKKPVLVEDVSFEIGALKGLPGTFIKFFLKTLGTEGTVALIKGKNTNTKVTTAAAIYDGQNLKVFKGTIYGTLSSKDRGKYGFGFDKVFIPNGYSKTFAQMPSSLKNKISHRAKVLRKVLAYLDSPKK